MLRVQAPLYRRGPGYRFTVAIRSAAGSRAAASLAWSSDPALGKTLYKVSFPRTGIWRAYPFAFASDPVVGKGLRSPIGWTWSWRSSLLLCAPPGLVGAVPLLARQPLGSFVSIARHQSSSVESSAGCWRSRPFEWSRSSWRFRSHGDSWDASRHVARLVVRPLSHPHDTSPWPLSTNTTGLL
jgi:hypothetical protein